MSLLIIRCPLKPFAGTDTASPSDWQELSCAEQFEWALLDDANTDTDSELAAGTQFGVGTTESMPYADEALVLLPTLDVRLIDAKVPLANAKKLQQILPNLIEDFVLTGVDSIAAQVLPPVPGSPALQRTLALIDRAWLSWLNQELERLLTPRVRLIPECLLLSMSEEGEPSVLAYQRFEDSMIFTQRTGLQLGVSWVEHAAAGAGEDVDVQDIVLPQALVGSALKEITWGWFIPAAKEYLYINHNSRAPNFALNLLPKYFKSDAKSFGKAGLASVTGIFSGKGLRSSINAAGLAWTDPLVWRQPFNWLRYLVISLVMGYGVYVSWILVSDWRWGKQMELLAVQSLSPASVTALNQAKDLNSTAAVLNTFTKQVTVDQRRRGVVVDADFAAMAAKLQQLKAAYGPEVLQKIEYDGYAIVFELKSGIAMTSPKEVLKRARSLGMAITTLGSNQYRLEPYSGLGVIDE
jgi:hypothetical protein